jgi:hypothetical protein
MPKSAQLLYFHYGMEADNDGFIANPITLARLCGCAKSDYRTLINKRFLIAFPSGVCVIKHHWINNNVRKDRYKHTKYAEEYALLEQKDNGAYTEKSKPSTSDGAENVAANGSQLGMNLATTGIPPDMNVTTNSCLNITEHNRTEQYPCAKPDDFARFWQAYPRKQHKKDAVKAWEQVKKKGMLPPLDTILKAIEEAKRSEQWQREDGRFIPLPASWLRGGYWDDEYTTTTGPTLTEVELIRDAEGLKAGERLKVEILDGGMCRATFPGAEPTVYRFDRFFKEAR